jgi:phosphatidylglycerophosphatase A
MKIQTTKRKSDFLVRAFALGFGAGRMPLAPGTWGALEGLIIVYGIHRLLPSQETIALWSLCLVLGLITVLSADYVARQMNSPDPQEVVADEIVGQMACFLWVPITGKTLIIGFVLFRFFDISKPFPAGRSEHLPGGLGIIADDLVAAVYAGIILRLMTTYLIST